METVLTDDILNMLANLASMSEEAVGPCLAESMARLPGIDGVQFIHASDSISSSGDWSCAVGASGEHVGNIVVRISDSEAFADSRTTIEKLCFVTSQLLERNRPETTGKADDENHIVLSETVRRLNELFDRLPDPCWLIENGRFIDCNRAALSILGYPSKEELLGHPANLSPRYQPDGKLSAEKADEMIREAISKGVHRFEWEHRKLDGTCFPAEVTLAKISTVGDNREIIYCTWRDISSRKQMEKQVYVLAFFDPLTSLPNRRLLLEQLKHRVTTGGGSSSHAALMCLDLDHFKTINDTQGHRMGDRLLSDIAGRLNRIANRHGMVARIGGDEFAVLVQHLDVDEAVAVSQLTTLGEQILEELSKPCVLDSVPYPSGASLGIVLFRGESLDPTEIMKRADLAMHQAKSAGRGTLRFFDQEILESITRRASLEVDLRQAPERGELVLFLQPQVSSDGHCTGAEALIRWKHPERGMIPPSEFIPLAEESGLIVPVGQWVLAESCRILKTWQYNPSTAGLRLSANVSARQFFQPDFVEGVARLLRDHDIMPSRLKIEITESMLLGSIEHAIATMHQLRLLGVTFSLDDFGTGYSSLNYVKRLPIDQIKIDRSFVRDIHTDTSDAAICRAVIAMGHSLGLGTVAEGVETEEQWDFLKAEGCQVAQGFLYARPMPSDEFISWLESRA